MTEKLESNEVTESPAGTVALVVLVAVELPHAATMLAIAPANTIAVDDLSLRNCLPPNSSGDPGGKRREGLGYRPVGPLDDPGVFPSYAGSQPTNIVGPAEGMRKSEV